MSRSFIQEGHFVCECGREFTKSQSLYAHQRHCKIHLGDRYDENIHGDRIGDKRAWSRGLTKETDDRVRNNGIQVSIAKKGKPGRPHTDESKAKLSKAAQYNASHHINGWKSGNNRIPNKYEVLTEQFLAKHSIPYEAEVVVPQSELGKKGSYYQLDFLINNEIDLEIDGTSHNSEHDTIRDSYIRKKYTVYRINHKDSLSSLENELFEFKHFLDTYKYADVMKCEDIGESNPMISIT